MSGEIIKSIASLVCVFVIGFLVFATPNICSQTQKKGKAAQTPQKGPPSTCETAVIRLQAEVDELRRQLSRQQTEKATPPLETGSIEIEAALVFESRDVKPVVRERFYLLKEDPASLILTKENYELAKREAAKEEFTRRIIASKFEEWNFKQATLYSELFPPYQEAILKILDAKAAAKAETGFDGKLRLDGVPTGTYYLFGVYHYAEAGYDYGFYMPKAVIWNLPVTVKAGLNKIILDNKNTL